MEDKEKKGSYKKKGSAQESNAQEASNDVNDMEGGMKNAGDVAGVPKKKGAAAKTGSGEKEMTAKELKAEGKKLKQQARDKKKADRKSARATKKSDRKTKKSQKLQDKIDLQTLKGEQKLKSGDVVSSKAKRDRVEKLKTKKEKLDGAAKKKGSADYSFDKGSHDHPHDGAGRMGFTQNFGAARQNSYAKGAARVASIMSFGASRKKGAADSGHGEPVGHDHPTKTIKSRQVSGGGSDSSSSSVSNSNIPKASGGEQTKNISGYMTALNKRFPNTSGADLASKKYISSDMVGNYDSNFRSNSNSSSNPRGVSESSQTTVSPMSMSETLKSGQLQTENRNETNKFNKEITNITASNDSIVAANKYINTKPAYDQNNPKVLNAAGIKGGLAAYQTRSVSGDFSRKKAYDMFKAGTNKN